MGSIGHLGKRRPSRLPSLRSCLLRNQAALGLAQTPTVAAASQAAALRGLTILTRLNKPPCISTPLPPIRRSARVICSGYTPSRTPRRDAAMDAPEPDTPFSAVTAQTTKYGRVCHPPQYASRSLLEVGGDGHGARDEYASVENAPLLMRRADVPGISRQVDTIHHIPVGRNRLPFPHVWPAHIRGPRMVHWYVYTAANTLTQKSPAIHHD